MSNSTRAAIALLVLAQGMASCGGSSSTGPSPPGTLGPSQPKPLARQLTGYVTDTALRPLPGTIVEVLDGPQAGLTATTNAAGQFGLFGIFDNSTRFRASVEGHVPTLGTIYSCATCSGQFMFLNLPSLVPPVKIAGDYTLTLVADGACNGLPDEDRSRTYAATIAPAPSTFSPPDTLFTLTVSGAAFLTHYGAFSVAVAGDVVAFWIGSEGPSLVEERGSNSYLAFDGRAEAAVGSELSAVSTPFEGIISYCALKSPMGTAYTCNPTASLAHAECESAGHRLVLTRR
jgi:hypothetical protein